MIDCFGIKILYDAIGNFTICKTEYPIRYWGLISIAIPIKVRKDIQRSLRKFMIHSFIIRGSLIIKGNENILEFLNMFEFYYKYEQVDILRKFTKHRLSCNKKRFDANDEYYLEQMNKCKSR